MTAIKRLTPVPFTEITINDAFWAPRIETNRTATIPAEYKMCLDTGRIAAFDLTWRPGDPNPPHIFWDSDVAKWIEAASYSIAAHPDADLDTLLDDVISRIGGAQQSGGYLNTHYVQVEPDKRWTNLRDCHELYCAGHMIEAAVAHHKATGKRTLLDIMCRYANYIGATFGPDPLQKHGYCGHEEIELALMKLYRVTSESRYLQLASYFVDERGQQPYYFDVEARERGEDPANFWAKSYAYMQALIPVREQSEVTGHAVRAMYLYSAMADLAAEESDVDLLATCERLWEDLCLKRMYITGGIGPSASNEGFTTHYDLPDETAYAETCAAVGLVFWNHRMLQLTGDGKYADVMERALYNGAISGVSLDGQRFFYENPLASAGAHHRKSWFDCACCPPNIARLIASVGEYVYSTSEKGIWTHLYIEGKVNLAVNGKRITLQQTTQYPWSGDVLLSLEMETDFNFDLNLRIPGWCHGYSISVNGESWDPQVANGYVTINRTWRNADQVQVHLEMPVEYIQAHPNVEQMSGRVALQRGPVVYCLEGCDHSGIALDDILLRTDIPASQVYEPVYRPDALGGVIELNGAGALMNERSWDGVLYRAVDEAVTNVRLRAIPYYAWDNRAPGTMRVWFRRG